MKINIINNLCRYSLVICAIFLFFGLVYAGDLKAAQGTPGSACTDNIDCNSGGCVNGTCGGSESGTETCYKCHPGANFCASYKVTRGTCSTNCNDCQGGSSPPPPPPSSPALLPVPTGLNVSCSGNQATFSWNAVPGAGSYLLRFNKQPNNWKDVRNGDAGKTVTGTSFTWSTTSCISEKDESGNNVNVCFSPNATYNWWSVQPFKPGEQYPSANPHGGGASFTCARVTPSLQCFIATEDPSQRNGLLSCGQAGAVAYTQHPTTINPFNLSSGDGVKTIFVRFLKLTQGETLQSCNDPARCLDRSYPITLSIPACTTFVPDGLTRDTDKIVGGVRIPVYKTGNADGSADPTHLSITYTPANASVDRPASTGLQFASTQGNSNDWSVSSIPRNTNTTNPAEYTVTTTITFAGQTRQCPSFIIRVPAASVGGCECSAAGACTAACTFTNLSGITYTNPMKCSLNSNLSITNPSPTNKNSWCNRVKRTLGDADNNGQVDTVDYTYWLRAANGGTVPPNVNPDFNGDSEVGRADLDIWKLGRGQ